MNLATTTLALAAAMLLAACGQQADPDTATPTQAAKTAKGTGTVKAIDKTAGTITLDHGPIAQAGWPAMTMAFAAAPDLLDSVKAGDKVEFDLALKDGSGEVVAITRQ